MFERLENRQMMSVSFSGTQMIINGTYGNDNISVYQDFWTGNVVVNDNGVVSNHLASAVGQVVVHALDGNDSVTGYNSLLEQLVIYGGPGNDTLRGGGYNDWIYGQDGDDNVEGRSGADLVSGGNGTDLADFSTYSAALNISLDNVWNDTGTGGAADNVWYDVENINGGYGNDTVTGSAYNNYLQGAGGKDYLYGLDGNDTLDGGVGGVAVYSQNTGDDVLIGGNHNDTLHASDHGNNHMVGGEGDDWMHGYGGNDYMDGLAGNDLMYGGVGADTMYGYTGIDTLYGQDGNDRVLGESDRDYLYGGYGVDSVRGGSGNDFIYGEQGDDSLWGDGGADYVYGEDGRDNLYGGTENDYLHGGTGDDGLFGGSGTDTLTGASGDDRFLDRTWEDDYIFFKIRRWEDSVTDYESDFDALLGFQNAAQQTVNFAGQNGSYTFAAGNWTDAEIELMDSAFEVLHDATLNTRLLQRSNGDNQIFFRAGAQIASSGGTFTAAAWNSGGSVTFANGTFNSDFSARDTMLHEMGHNWDTEFNAAGWRAQSGWVNSATSPGAGFTQGGDASGTWWYQSTAGFVSGYARTNPNEDFAEHFAAFFTNRAGWSSITIPAGKNTFMANMVASL